MLLSLRENPGEAAMKAAADPGNGSAGRLLCFIVVSAECIRRDLSLSNLQVYPSDWVVGNCR
jgi:hypothetical protein